MLGSFLQRGLSRRQAEAEIPLQIPAGSDTTATAIRITMLHVITCPRIMEKLCREIDGAIANRQISNPVTCKEATKLEYLQACISEGLRIHPPFTGLVMKKVPPWEIISEVNSSLVAPTLATVYGARNVIQFTVITQTFIDPNAGSKLVQMTKQRWTRSLILSSGMGAGDASANQ